MLPLVVFDPQPPGTSLLRLSYSHPEGSAWRSKDAVLTLVPLLTQWPCVEIPPPPQPVGTASAYAVSRLACWCSSQHSVHLPSVSDSDRKLGSLICADIKKWFSCCSSFCEEELGAAIDQEVTVPSCNLRQQLYLSYVFSYFTAKVHRS